MALDYSPPVAGLSAEDEAFALAVVATGGNITAAYAATFGGSEKSDRVRDRAVEKIGNPAVMLRVRQLQSTLEAEALITLGSHLAVLAEIRDAAMSVNRYQEAIAAETRRGEAMGYYRTTINLRHSVVGRDSLSDKIMAAVDEREEAKPLAVTH
jgi:hypothetical protein